MYVYVYNIKYLWLFFNMTSVILELNCDILVNSLENRGKLGEELKRADAVVLTYACDQPSTLDRLSTFWLPELRRLEVCSDYCLKNLEDYFEKKSMKY